METASVITPPTQQEAYEAGRAAGRLDRSCNVWSPNDQRTWRDVAGYYSGYEHGWALQELIESEIFASEEEAQFELEITLAELNADR